MVAGSVLVAITIPNVPGMPVPVSRILYREFLLGSTGSMSRTQEMRGAGVPTAEHSNTALWPISTTFVLGACVICGKPDGSLSSETQITHIFYIYKFHGGLKGSWKFEVTTVLNVNMIIRLDTTLCSSKDNILSDPWRYQLTKQHGVASQKAVMLNIMRIRTLNFVLSMV
jgi:hypothetical protein